MDVIDMKKLKLAVSSGAEIPDPPEVVLK